MFTVNAKLKTFFAAFALVAVTLTGAGTASAQQIIAEQVESERRAGTLETAGSDKAEREDETKEAEAARKGDEDDSDEITFDDGLSPGETII